MADILPANTTPPYQESWRAPDGYPGFVGIVGAVSLADTVVPVRRRGVDAPLPDMTDFSLIALQKNWYEGVPDNKPQGFEFPKGYAQDAKYGLGLVRADGSGKQVLCAVAAADRDSSGRMVIKQLQGYDGAEGGSLRMGFDWRRSLVAAWMVASRGFGAHVVGIQGAANNKWQRRVGSKVLDDQFAKEYLYAHHGAKPEEVKNALVDYMLALFRKLGADAYEKMLLDAGIQALYPRYDGVAKSMKFTRSEDGNWYAPVVAAPQLVAA